MFGEHIARDGKPWIIYVGLTVAGILMPGPIVSDSIYPLNPLSEGLVGMGVNFQ